MKAIVKTKREYGSVEIIDVPDPEEPSGNEVLVDVRSSAICGSDVHSYEYIPSSHFIKVPVILGHEFSGVVKAIGKDVTKYKVGDRVMGESNKYCGVCENCRIGKTNVCNNSLMRGLTFDGVMAEQVKIGDNFLHKLSDDTPFEYAAVAQPCSVVVHGVFDNCNVMPGDSVVVFGPGIMGNAAAQLARIKGAGNVFLVGTNQDADMRLPIAENMGFIPVNAQEQSLEEVIFAYTGKKSVDVVIECSGAPSALSDGSKIIKKNGYLTVLGIYGRNVELDITNLVRKEVNVRTSYTSTWNNYETALDLIGKCLLNLSPLCTVYDYNDALQAFQDAIDKTVLKPILRFND